MRLLIVEDERALRAVLSERLKKEGYSVDACATGTDARHYLTDTPYDIVLLDIMLPGVDGLTLLREVREQRKDTPICSSIYSPPLRVLSYHGSKEKRSTFFANWIFDFRLILSLPYSQTEIHSLYAGIDWTIPGM